MSALGIDEFLQTVNYAPILWLPKKEFAKRFGITVDAINGKIRDAKWQYGREYIRDPDGLVHVSVIGYQKWIESEWRKLDEKEAQYQRIAESSYSNSGGTIQSKAQQKNTGGQLKQVKRRLKAIDGKQSKR